MAAVRLSLVQCPVWGTDEPPLGLAQVAGCVTHCGQEARVFDLNLSLWREGPAELRRFWSWDSLPYWSDPDWTARALESAGGWLDARVREILAGDPHAAAFSVSEGSQWASIEVFRRLKRLSPATTVVVGGPYLQRPGRAEELLEAGADIAIVGVGEDVVPKLVGLYKATGRWVPLPGMLVRGEGGVVLGGRPVPYTFDLDISPFPDFSGFRWSDYGRPEVLPVSGSRGCPWSCAFCASREFWAKWSFKSGDRIFGDVCRARAQNPGARRVEFYDVMANGNVPSLVRFAEMMARGGPATDGLAWAMNAAPRPEMTRAALGAMRVGGCAEIRYGVESGSRATLAAMGKPLEPSAVERVLRETRDAGIRCSASFVAGFPGETQEAFEETLDFLRRCAPALDSVWIEPAAAEAPSLLQRRPERFGPLAEGAARAERLRRTARELGLTVEERRFTVGSTAAPAATA